MLVPPARDITGVILAGGRARRMGGQDKGLIPLAGRPLIEWVMEGLAPQVHRLLINANRNRERYGRYGYTVVADEIGGFQGPLAGFLSAMHACETPWLVVVPCDGPRLPDNLVRRLGCALAKAEAEIAVASDGRRMQPVYALMPVALADSLQDFLASGERKIDRWYARHRIVLEDFSDVPETFANVNTPEDSAGLEREVAP